VVLSLFCRHQSNLQAEMEAEKQICHTKKRALQIATDELAKNHETIKQQERTVEKLQKGVEWRSLVMMRMSDELKIAPEGIKLN
jgi:spindle assembly abnormal protein 6